MHYSNAENTALTANDIGPFSAKCVAPLSGDLMRWLQIIPPPKSLNRFITPQNRLVGAIILTQNRIKSSLCQADNPSIAVRLCYVAVRVCCVVVRLCSQVRGVKECPQGNLIG